jgi:hypothetical protein
VVAAGAAVLLNGAILGTYVWSDLFVPDLRRICWLLVAITWAASAGVSAWIAGRREGRPPGEAGGDRFPEAIEEYLKGNWFETEQLLNRVLRRDPHDLESRLLLIGLLRHTKRFDEATRQLNLFVRLEGAGRWAVEAHREGELLAEARRHTITSGTRELANCGEN